MSIHREPRSSIVHRPLAFLLIQWCTLLGLVIRIGIQPLVVLAYGKTCVEPTATTTHVPMHNQSLSKDTIQCLLVQHVQDVSAEPYMVGWHSAVCQQRQAAPITKTIVNHIMEVPNLILESIYIPVIHIHIFGF